MRPSDVETRWRRQEKNGRSLKIIVYNKEIIGAQNREIKWTKSRTI